MLDLVNNIMSNFVSVIMCKIFFRKSKMDDIEAFEKLFYAFDFPSLTENGWIDISDNSIVLTFPEKPTVYVKDAYDIIQNSQLFVNNQLVFAIDWLPIYTLLDFLRVKDMLEKCLQSYTNLIGEKVFVPHTYLWAPNKIFNSAVTNFSKGDDFILYCYEDPNTSQIQLTLPESTDCNTDISINFQICIGKNIVFCAQRDLSSLSKINDIHFILQFILYKLIKY